MELLKKLSLKIIVLLIPFMTAAQTVTKDKQYYLEKAWTYQQTTKAFRDCIDSALVFLPNDAQLWREKATSHFKAGHIEPAMQYINKAVELDSDRWLSYRGFMKCVFMKDYANAIIDLKTVYKKTPLANSFDHSLPFWIGISYLKLDKLDSANHYLQLSIDQNIAKGKNWIHFVDWFYAGLAKYKQQNYQEAITYFDNAIAQNSNFPDAEYFKGMTLLALKNKEEATACFNKSKKAIESGYRMNEDNEIYVNYPYQITLEDINQTLNLLK